MSDLEILLRGRRIVVTALVVAGMILITPCGQVPVHADGRDPGRLEREPGGRARRRG